MLYSSCMPRQSRKYAQQRFDLYLDDSAEARLNRFLKDLAARGKMREWIVQALIQALKKDGKE